MGVAVVFVTAHVHAPSAEVSAAAQPCHVASSWEAATLQQEDCTVEEEKWHWYAHESQRSQTRKDAPATRRTLQNQG